MEERGEYEDAVNMLEGFWPGPGERPLTAGLTDEARATLLLRAGTLTGWLASQRQVEGWQETAKDLLSESRQLFLDLDLEAGYLDAAKHLGICYWREGAFGEARLIFQGALERTVVRTDDWIALELNLALVDFSEGNFQACLDRYARMMPAVETESHFLRGRFHNGLGIALKNLRETDRAIIELTAASYHFEQSGHERFQIAVDINLGNLFVLTKSYDDAHAALDRAEKLATKLRDSVHMAHAKDSRAQAWLTTRNYVAAELAARDSVQILERGSEHALLVDSLCTHARALIGLKDSKALAVYVRAYELAAELIGSEKAARVALETLGEMAGEACLTGHVTIESAKHAFEKSIVRRALEESAGKTTDAALRLGVIPQTLSWILQSRYPELRPYPGRKKRCKSIMKPIGVKARKSSKA